MKEDYETADLWQCAYLICKGARLKRMQKDRVKPGRIIFVLGGENLGRLAQDFFQSGEVSGLLFKETALNLKHSIYRFLRENNDGGGGYGSETTKRIS